MVMMVHPIHLAVVPAGHLFGGVAIRAEREWSLIGAGPTSKHPPPVLVQGRQMGIEWDQTMGRFSPRMPMGSVAIQEWC